MKSGSLQQLVQMFQNLSQGYTAEYKGQAVVSGQETYVVSVQPPKPLADLVKNQTIWLDQDTWFPIKQQITTQVGNQTITSTITFTKLSYNVSIPDERFTLEVPDNATVKNVTIPTPKTYTSIEKAENAVNFSIRTPNVPDGYSVKKVTVTKIPNKGTIVRVIYQSGSDTLTFTQLTRDIPIKGEEMVCINGYTGSYETLGNHSILSWDGGKFSYAISGTLSKSTLINIAESLDS
jgi:hypothetical protein